MARHETTMTMTMTAVTKRSQSSQSPSVLSRSHVHGVGNQVGKIPRTPRYCDGHSLTLATLPPSHSVHRLSSLSLPFSLSFSLSLHVSARLESTCHAVSSNFARHQSQAAQAASRARRGSSTVARTCHATAARAFLASK